MMYAEYVTLYGAMENPRGFFLSVDEALSYAAPHEAIVSYSAIKCQTIVDKHTGPWEYHLLSARHVVVGKDAHDKFMEVLREQAIGKLSDAELRSLGLKLDSEGCLVRI